MAVLAFLVPLLHLASTVPDTASPKSELEKLLEQNPNISPAPIPMPPPPSDPNLKALSQTLDATSKLNVHAAYERGQLFYKSQLDATDAEIEKSKALAKKLSFEVVELKEQVANLQEVQKRSAQAKTTDAAATAAAVSQQELEQTAAAVGEQKKNFEQSAALQAEAAKRANAAKKAQLQKEIDGLKVESTKLNRMTADQRGVLNAASQVTSASGGGIPEDSEAGSPEEQAEAEIAAQQRKLMQAKAKGLASQNAVKSAKKEAKIASAKMLADAANALFGDLDPNDPGYAAAMAEKNELMDALDAQNMLRRQVDDMEGSVRDLRAMLNLELVDITNSRISAAEKYVYDPTDCNMFGEPQPIEA